MSTNPNPYIGPRTFQENERDLFYGREREASELLARVLSDQEIVFYAQSGAGNSSLINTSLIPDLKKKGSSFLRQFGLTELRSWLKTSRLVRNLLYKQYTPDHKPKMNPDSMKKLKDHFCDEVFHLDALLSLAISDMWGYSDYASEPVSGSPVSVHA